MYQYFLTPLLVIVLFRGIRIYKPCGLHTLTKLHLWSFLHRVWFNALHQMKPLCESPTTTPLEINGTCMDPHCVEEWVKKWQTKCSSMLWWLTEGREVVLERMTVRGAKRGVNEEVWVCVCVWRGGKKVSYFLCGIKKTNFIKINMHFNGVKSRAGTDFDSESSI